jgi:L-threonylcarbamoyladenylate synthase
MVTWARPGLAPLLVRDGKIGVRVPGPSPALDLVRAFAGPLTATSANRAGHPPLSSAAQARRSLGDGIGAIVGDRAPGGTPSTVLDVTVDPPETIREGALVVP